LVAEEVALHAQIMVVAVEPVVLFTQLLHFYQQVLLQ
jgi:hypothetical protein